MVSKDDKSRIKDLAPRLSPTEFAGTKFSVDDGWNHPDGSVTSTNTIGKYLNALRDLGIYQLVNADYSFGNDNSVDITIHLVCSGFQQLKTISAAGGIYTNLDVVMDKVKNDVEALFTGDLDDTERAKKVKEIRAELKISNNDLNKNSTLILFDKLKDFDKLGIAGTLSAQEKDDTLEALLRLI